MNEQELNVAIEKLAKYYIDICTVDNNRYLSWEHCYEAFCQARNKAHIDYDYLCLNLAFYLASWGMYRGSSFLLQKDYKFHRPVVEELMNPRYDCLVGIKADELRKQDNLDILFEMSDVIIRIYEEAAPGHLNRKNHVTDTLVTKIMLGTLGCVPAYDRYFVKSIRKYDIASGSYNAKSMTAICDFYVLHSAEFEKLDIPYPNMKIIDMCMWQLGVDD